MVRRGSITVFLALILGLLIVLIGAALESVRVSCARVHILNGTDVGLYSLLPSMTGIFWKIMKFLVCIRLLLQKKFP